MTERPNPMRILETGFAFWGSKVLLTAVRLGLFTRLGERAMTGRELETELELHPRGTFDFLDALVSMGFLEREGDGEQGRYSNALEAAAFLDASQPEYIGGMLEMLDARLFGYWNDLGEALKTGQAQNETKHGLKPIFEELYSEAPRLEQFLSAMAGLSAPNFAALAEKFDFSRYQTLCDVGGASGLLSVLVAQAHPQLRCTSFDLPPVEPLARNQIQAAGLSERITAVSGDFFAEPLPKADVITMGMILHDWNLEKKLQLIEAAYSALPEGGALIAVENLIDDERRKNSFGLLMSLNMLIEFGEAFDFSGADFRGWCEQVGFREFEVIHLNGPCSAAVAYK